MISKSRSLHPEGVMLPLDTIRNSFASRRGYSQGYFVGKPAPDLIAA